MKRLLIIRALALILTPDRSLAATAIFTDQAAAKTFADPVHLYLTATKPSYNADRWAVPQKDPTEDKWAIPMPPEIMNPPAGATMADELGADWYPNMEIPS